MKDKFVVKVIELEREEWGFKRLISQEIVTNKGGAFGVHDMTECPEDAMFGRDLPDAEDVLGLMRRAYEAGKEGLEFEVIYEEEEE